MNMVLQASRHYIIIKKDMKKAFCDIPITLLIQWLLGFL